MLLYQKKIYKNKFISIDILFNINTDALQLIPTQLLPTRIIPKFSFHI